MMHRALPVALSIASGLALAARAQETPTPPTFGTAVETVYLDVFVGEDGKPVEGLTVESFQVKDNGVRQQVELVSAEQVPLRVILAFDVSGNLAGAGLAQLQKAGQGLLAALAPEERADLLTFSHELRRAPGRSPAELQSALAAVQAGGATALYDAAFAALALAEGRETRPIVILFSDGKDVQSLLDADAVYETARLSAATVYTVHTQEEGPARLTATAGTPAAPPSRDMQAHDAYDLGNRGPRGNTNERFEAASRAAVPRGVTDLPEAPRFLARLAEETGGRTFAVGVPDMEATFREILHDARTRYLLRYDPSGVDQAGWHEVDVKLPGRPAEVRARKGYFRPEASGG